MIVEKLTIRHLRTISHADLTLAPGFNVITGDNGAGKTSVLEAVYILSSGRSFRTPKLELIRQQGQAEMQIAARILGPDGAHQLGLGKQKDQMTLRLDGNKAAKIADLAHFLAVIALHADSDQLIQGPPLHRRRFLDWWLFHTQPAFFPEWMRYQRLLKQRNASLREDPQQIEAWDAQLAESGEKIAAWRQYACDILMTQLQSYLQRDPDFPDFGWSLHLGWWRGESLSDALKRSKGRDMEQGFTSVGPHRAELRLMIMGREAREVLSRGQQKALAALMLMAQTETYRAIHKSTPVMLLDDLAAELDTHHRQRILQQLGRLEGQILLTALEESEWAEFLPQGARRFAIRAGEVTML